MKVRNRMQIVLAAWALVLLMPISALASAQAFRQYERTSLPSVESPNVAVHVLPNGMRVFLMPDHTVPVIKVRAYIRSGGIYEPADKVGLAELTGMLLRSGGAGELSPQLFDAAVDNLGAALGMDFSNEMGTATLQCLSPDLTRALNLLSLMLFAPKFDASRLGAAKLNLAEQLRREEDDPETLAAISFRKLVYGDESPWARRPTSSTIDKVSRDDIVAFHQRYFTAENIIIAAAGDFDPKDFIRELTEVTAKAPTGKTDFPEVAPVTATFTPAEEQIERKVTQAYIRTGHLGVKRDNPDKFALFVLDEILGAGSFKSRLMDDIRVKRGMAYHVFSNVAPGKDLGLITIGVNTKAAGAEKVLELVRDHVERLAEKGDVTTPELTFAKQSILSRFIFEFDRPFKIVDQQARFFFFGYPKDYWRLYHDRIVATNLHELTRVGKLYLHPDALRTVIVGPKVRTDRNPEERRTHDHQAH